MTLFEEMLTVAMARRIHLKKNIHLKRIEELMKTKHFTVFYIYIFVYALIPARAAPLII